MLMYQIWDVRKEVQFLAWTTGRLELPFIERICGTRRFGGGERNQNLFLNKQILDASFTFNLGC